MPLISIIVPVYNTEKYLRRCLDSLVNQTFNDIEIIIVNDASQGNCKEIIEEYQKKDNRIKYIEHSENKSLLQARKTGYMNFTGEYVMNVDSDDEIEINTCEEIYKIVSKEDYDFIRFSAKIYSKYDIKRLQQYLSYSLERNVIKYPFIEFLYGKLSHNIWGGVIKKDIIEKSIKYIPDIYLTNCEDLLQFGIITYFCQSIKILNKKLYIYYYGLSDLPKIENLDLAKYEHLCNTTKKALDEIYNFLCKLNVEKIYSYSFLSLLYNNYMYLNQFRDEIYINILNNTFGKDFMQKYNKFLEVSNYNNQYSELLQITNEKLIQYLFSIIMYGKIKIIKIFGIQINLKSHIYYDKPIVISLSSFFNNIFSIKIDDKYFVLKILFIKLSFRLKLKN